MEIDKERLDQLIFGISISSGPPVYILYSPDSNDFYTTLNLHPRSPADEIVFVYDMSYRISHRWDSLSTEVKSTISNFKPLAQIREEKLGDLLK